MTVGKTDLARDRTMVTTDLTTNLTDGLLLVTDIAIDVLAEVMTDVITNIVIGTIDMIADAIEGEEVTLGRTDITTTAGRIDSGGNKRRRDREGSRRDAGTSRRTEREPLYTDGRMMTMRLIRGSLRSLLRSSLVEIGEASTTRAQLVQSPNPRPLKLLNIQLSPKYLRKEREANLHLDHALKVLKN
jgi:hypothetical protein